MKIKVMTVRWPTCFPSNRAESSQSRSLTMSSRLLRSRSMLRRSWHNMNIIAVTLSARRGSDSASDSAIRISVWEPFARRCILKWGKSWEYGLHKLNNKLWKFKWEQWRYYRSTSSQTHDLFWGDLKSSGFKITRIQTQVRTVTSPTPYHWASPLS